MLLRPGLAVRSGRLLETPPSAELVKGSLVGAASENLPTSVGFAAGLATVEP